VVIFFTTKVVSNNFFQQIFLQQKLCPTIFSNKFRKNKKIGVKKQKNSVKKQKIGVKKTKNWCKKNKKLV